jgi:hypothetical protein
MSEPTSAAVAAGTVAIFGFAGVSSAVPQMADLALICICAAGGSAMQLSTMVNKDGSAYTKMQAAIYLLVTAIMAVALTGLIGYGIERIFGLPHVMTGAPIAFLIGARREWVLAKVTGAVDKATGGEKP